MNDEEFKVIQIIYLLSWFLPPPLVTLISTVEVKIGRERKVLEAQ